MKKNGRFVRAGKELVVTLLIYLFLRSSIVEPYKIPSGSMIPTLFIGDNILVNKFAYGFKLPFADLFIDQPIYLTPQRVPARGDVIVFRYPRDESITFIKRVVGLPGDTIEIREKVLYLNGQAVRATPLDNPALMAGAETDEDRRTLSLFNEDLPGAPHPVLYAMRSSFNASYGPVTVPPGALLCLGDNRDRSSDGRFWGFVPLANVKGKALFVWLNYLFWPGGEPGFQFLPSRIGTVIR